jgi:hypothetical protein
MTEERCKLMATLGVVVNSLGISKPVLPADWRDNIASQNMS